MARLPSRPATSAEDVADVPPPVRANPNSSTSLSFIADVPSAVAQIEQRMASAHASAASRIRAPAPTPSLDPDSPPASAAVSRNGIVTERVDQFERSAPMPMPASFHNRTPPASVPTPPPVVKLSHTAVEAAQSELDRLYNASAAILEPQQENELPDAASSSVADVVQRFEAAVSDFESRVTSEAPSVQLDILAKAIAPTVDQFETPTVSKLPVVKTADTPTVPIAPTVKLFETSIEDKVPAAEHFEIPSTPIATALEQFEAPSETELPTVTRVNIPSVPIGPTVQQFEAPFDPQVPAVTPADRPSVPTAPSVEISIEGELPLIELVNRPVSPTTAIAKHFDTPFDAEVVAVEQAHTSYEPVERNVEQSEAVVGTEGPVAERAEPPSLPAAQTTEEVETLVEAEVPTVELSDAGIAIAAPIAGNCEACEGIEASNGRSTELTSVPFAPALERFERYTDIIAPPVQQVNGGDSQVTTVEDQFVPDSAAATAKAQTLDATDLGAGTTETTDIPANPGTALNHIDIVNSRGSTPIERLEIASAPAVAENGSLNAVPASGVSTAEQTETSGEADLISEQKRIADAQLVLAMQQLEACRAVREARQESPGTGFHSAFRTTGQVTEQSEVTLTSESDGLLEQNHCKETEPAGASSVVDPEVRLPASVLESRNSATAPIALIGEETKAGLATDENGGDSVDSGLIVERVNAPVVLYEGALESLQTGSAAARTKRLDSSMVTEFATKSVPGIESEAVLHRLQNSEGEESSPELVGDTMVAAAEAEKTEDGFRNGITGSVMSDLEQNLARSDHRMPEDDFSNHPRTGSTGDQTVTVSSSFNKVKPGIHTRPVVREEWVAYDERGSNPMKETPTVLTNPAYMPATEQPVEACIVLDANSDIPDRKRSVETAEMELADEPLVSIGATTELDKTALPSTPVKTQGIECEILGSPVTPNLQVSVGPMCPSRGARGDMQDGSTISSKTRLSRRLSRGTRSFSRSVPNAPANKPQTPASVVTRRSGLTSNGVAEIKNHTQTVAAADTLRPYLQSPSRVGRPPRTFTTGDLNKNFCHNQRAASARRASSRLPRVAELTGNEGREKAMLRPRLPRGATFSGTVPRTRTNCSPGRSPAGLSELAVTRYGPLNGSDNESTTSTPVAASPKTRFIRRSMSFSDNRRSTMAGSQSSQAAFSAARFPVGTSFGSRSGRRLVEMAGSATGKVERRATMSVPEPSRARPPRGANSGLRPFAPPKIPRNTPTVPQPFRLAGVEMHEKAMLRIEEARKRAEEIESRRFPFQPTPLPDFYSKPKTDFKHYRDS